ncbi:MAG: hypothetical protein COT85_05205 [Chlamydiae bacterium CG10_big_fil_rev_8_21_14_0_10_42_34]|nr:MAG: hypothetical protein COT85_05205 [Chlamydiae bacterium CG10_big_fil_rev_8_21_14_0_10_42_34]
MLQIFDTGIQSAADNMLLDAKLLDQLKEPTLHLYQWARPSATFGYFIRPEKHLDLQKVAQRHLDLARRPTGGGIVFHIWDLAFSFLLPSTHPAFSLGTLDNYRFVNNIVLDVMKNFFTLKDPVELIAQNAPSLGPDCQNFCMAKPTQYDVVYKGLKIAGAAQRKRKQGYLHQGTISLAYPHTDLLNDVLLSKKDVLEAMKSYTFAPLGRLWEPHTLQKTRIELQKLLADKFQRALTSTS